MALLRTVIEAKAALPRVLSNLSNNSLVPDFSAAEIKYLVPWIGMDQYDTINGKINADPIEELTAAETALLPYLRRVSAIYAYLDEMGTDNAKITDSGIRSTESANLPRVFGWQYKELKNTLLQKAADAVEVMLKFLHTHKTDYPVWASSDEYASFNSLLIKTGTDFNQHYTLYQPMRSFYSLRVLLDEVQEDFIKPSIGKALLDFFVQGDGLNDDEKGFLKLLKKAATYMVVKKACQHYSVRFDSNGFTILAAGDSENHEVSGRTAADLSLFEMKMAACEKDAQTFLAKATKQMVTFRVGGGNEPFNVAYDEGPLVAYVDPADKTRGNETRKIFRF